MRVWPLLITIAAVTGVHCSDAPENGKPGAATTETKKDPVPETRTEINPEPVQTYVEELDNNFQFRVELFETDQTFSYQLKLRYQEFTAEDTVTFPNFGQWPKPVLRKAPEGAHTVQLGFLDKDSSFRDYKTITATDDDMSVKTTSHYVIREYQRKAE